MYDLVAKVGLKFVLKIFFHHHSFWNTLTMLPKMTTYNPLEISRNVAEIKRILALYNQHISWKLVNYIVLPGHVSIWHFFVIVRFPIHSLPPYKAGCDTFRFKIFTPGPQVEEHSMSDQSIGDNSQLTSLNKSWKRKLRIVDWYKVRWTCSS